MWVAGGRIGKRCAQVGVVGPEYFYRIRRREEEIGFVDCQVTAADCREGTGTRARKLLLLLIDMIARQKRVPKRREMQDDADDGGARKDLG